MKAGAAADKAEAAAARVVEAAARALEAVAEIADCTPYDGTAFSFSRFGVLTSTLV